MQRTFQNDTPIDKYNLEITQNKDWGRTMASGKYPNPNIAY